MLPALLPIAIAALPALAEWLGGSRAVGERAADVVRAVTGTDDPEAAAAVLADPAKLTELQIALSQIQAQERAAERQAAVQELTAILADVEGARRQTQTLAASGSPLAWGAPIVSAVVLSLWVFTVIAPSAGWASDVSGDDKRIIEYALIAVLAYWIGSSQGSKRSGDAVRDIAVRSAK